MFDHPGTHQKIHPNLDTTQSTHMPSALPPSSDSQIATISTAAARCKDQQSSLGLSKSWTQAEHNVLYVIHYLMPFTWKAAIEQLSVIDKHTELSREFSAQELFEQVECLNKAYGFQQIPWHSENIVREEGMELKEMLLYLDMMQASATAGDQRDRIGIAFPVVHHPGMTSGQN